MSKPCEICINKNRLEIDKAIVSGHNLKELAKNYDVEYYSLYRHSQNHVIKKLSQAIEKRQLNESFDLLNIVDKSLSDIRTIYERNFDQGKDLIALKAMDSARNMMDLLIKASYEFHQAKLLELEIIKEQNKKGADQGKEELEERLKIMFSKRDLKLFKMYVDIINNGKPVIIIPDKVNKFDIVDYIDKHYKIDILQ
jgi:hypothetical protein